VLFRYQNVGQHPKTAIDNILGNCVLGRQNKNQPSYLDQLTMENITSLQMKVIENKMKSHQMVEVALESHLVQINL